MYTVMYTVLYTVMFTVIYTVMHTVMHTLKFTVMYTVLYTVMYTAMYTVMYNVMYTVLYTLLCIGEWGLNVVRLGTMWSGVEPTEEMILFSKFLPTVVVNLVHNFIKFAYESIQRRQIGSFPQVKISY